MLPASLSAGPPQHYSWGEVGLLGTHLRMFCLCRCLLVEVLRERERDGERILHAAFALSYFEVANPERHRRVLTECVTIRLS